MINELIKWKLEGYKVFQLNFIDGFVIFKPLNWKEYKVIRELATTAPYYFLEVEDEIWKMGVLKTSYTEEELDKYSGIISTVARVIYMISGPEQIEDYSVSMENARFELEHVDEQISTLIGTTYKYPKEQIDRLPWNEVAKLLVGIESLTGQPINFTPKDNKQKNFSNNPNETVIMAG